MQALLTVRTTAGIDGDGCLRTADLISRLAARLYDYVGNSDDALLKEAEADVMEWERLADLCKRRESEQQVDLSR